MQKLLLAFLLCVNAYAQSPQADIVKSELLHYNKTKTRLVVLVRNIAPTEVKDVWLKVSGNASTARRKVPYLLEKATREVVVDVETADGPWRVEVESVDWSGH